MELNQICLIIKVNFLIYTVPTAGLQLTGPQIDGEKVQIAYTQYWIKLLKCTENYSIYICEALLLN